MDLRPFLDTVLNDFYDSFELNNTTSVKKGVMTIPYKNRIVTAQLMTPISKGKITVIKSGDKFFVSQDEEQKDITIGTKTDFKVNFYRNKNNTPKVSYIIFILSDKLPINVEQRFDEIKNPHLVPNIQVVEDIYLIDNKGSFTSIDLAGMRLDGVADSVIEPYLSFFSFLTQKKYKSFYNYLMDTKTLSESLSLASFELDDEIISRTKLKLFDYYFLFENASIYEKFNVRTAVILDENKLSPYELIELSDERPKAKSEYIPDLLKFYSTVKGDTPDTALDWGYLPNKIKNLGILNQDFPEIEGYDYPFAVEVTDRNDDNREISYFQVQFPDISYDPIQINNYESVLIGFKGVLKSLSDGFYFQEMGDVSIQVVSITNSSDTQEIEYSGVTNNKITGTIKIGNIDSVEIDDIGFIKGKKGISFFEKLN